MTAERPFGTSGPAERSRRSSPRSARRSASRPSSPPRCRPLSWSRAPADAERLARLHPGCDFLARDRIWAQGGLLHARGREAQPGLLERASELAELADRLPRLELRLGAARAELARLSRSAPARPRRSAASRAASPPCARSWRWSARRRDELAVAPRPPRRERGHAAAGALESRARARAARSSAQRGAADELTRREALHGERERAFDRAAGRDRRAARGSARSTARWAPAGAASSTC